MPLSRTKVFPGVADRANNPPAAEISKKIAYSAYQIIAKACFLFIFPLE
jgi:hypothetical protein